LHNCKHWEQIGIICAVTTQLLFAGWPGNGAWGCHEISSI